MSIFSQLFKSRDKPTNLTNGSAYRFLMGTSSAGKKVNERSAFAAIAMLHANENANSKLVIRFGAFLVIISSIAATFIGYNLLK